MQRYWTKLVDAAELKQASASSQDFSLEARRPEIEAIIADNTFMAELQSRIVPLIVEYNVFWTRYFYRLHLLREKHSQRQQLAQRAQQVRAPCAVSCSLRSPRA